MSEIYCKLLGLSHKDTMDVRVLILDTEHSSIRDLGLLDKSTDIERKLIHDIDLAIFAAPWDKFYEYDSGIMSEYITLGKQKDMFDRQREFFLKSYLSKDKIYFTDYCYNQFEKKARENITRILAEKYA